MEVGDFVLRGGMFNLGGHHEVQAHKFKFPRIESSNAPRKEAVLICFVQ